MIRRSRTRERLAAAAALLLVALPAAVLLYHRDRPEQRLLRHANVLVARVGSGAITHAHELREAMPMPPDFDGVDDGGRLELSWYLGPDSWFGVRFLIVHAHPQTERIERASVVFD